MLTMLTVLIDNANYTHYTNNKYTNSTNYANKQC